MSALAIGLLLGAGVFCIFWSTWPQTERSAPARRASLADRVRDQLVQAGFDTISPGQLLAACMVVFVIVFLGAYSMTRVVPIAICFAAMAGYGPRALVMARFVPFARTFITLIAGIGRMDFRRFITWTGVGAVA